MVSLNLFAIVAASVTLAQAIPQALEQDLLGSSRFFDVQGHRGGRGEAIENTLPAFAWGLIDGVSTLELDNGLTKDGAVVVWHDEDIPADKCKDTSPVTPGDSQFPYVGKYIANLTLAQIKTLDCGSQRLSTFPMQLTYPGTKISTLGEVFDFVRCVDKKRAVKFNIESKVNPVIPGSTRSPEDFVAAQYAAFVKSGYPLSQITYQSFDWRTLIGMKKRDSRVPTSALIQPLTATADGNGVFPFLAGTDLNSFPGSSIFTRIAQAAKSIQVATLSPASGTVPSPGLFSNKEMIDEAHRLGLTVVPWTVDDLNTAQALVDLGVDGIISDYPLIIRRLAEQVGRSVSAQRSQATVLQCLNKHIQRV
ncbi:PLC-like phosphodiesterase [Coprinellus micaceus]|uniref:PLC-like phosphodiesterase n=1 Tax=Coprinellus micaceus TaxID=71717 RepID=A0A4Y7TLP5_COPMI|nr:PLC-like phosphodiesterase [Coprinellus micaceus]